MKIKLKTKGMGISGCLILTIAVIALNVLLGGYCVQYSIEIWGTIIKGIAVTVPFWPCAIAGLFLGEIAIPVAVVTWILILSGIL